MRILLTGDMSGSRPDGTKWPARGNEVEVSDHEALSLIRGGMAVPAGADKDKELEQLEAAVAKEDRAVAVDGEQERARADEAVRENDSLTHEGKVVQSAEGGVQDNAAITGEEKGVEKPVPAKSEHKPAAHPHHDPKSHPAKSS